jgi:hypothetical protein
MPRKVLLRDVYLSLLVPQERRVLPGNPEAMVQFSSLDLPAGALFQLLDIGDVSGKRSDVFNPVAPTMITLLALFDSGNTGSYRGQARLEHFYKPTNAFQLTTRFALGEPSRTSSPAGGCSKTTGGRTSKPVSRQGSGQRHMQAVKILKGFSLGRRRSNAPYVRGSDRRGPT